jgi:Flp pilus assembly protein TadD
MGRLWDSGMVLGVLILLLSQAGCAEKTFLGDGGSTAAPLPGSSTEKGLPPQQAIQVSMAVADKLDKGGDSEAAIDQFERVIALDANNLHALRRLAVLYDCVGRTDRSDGLYSKIAKAAPRDATVFNDWGRHYYLANNFREAEDKFRIALRLDHNFVLARCNLALALGWQDRYPEAFQAFQQAGLKDAEAHCNIGFILFMQGRREQARQEWLEAYQMDPSCRKAEELLARMDAPPHSAPAPRRDPRSNRPAEGDQTAQAVYRSPDGRLWAPVNPQ